MTESSKRPDRKGSGHTPSRDPFVGKVVDDPKSFKGAVILAGFVGESTEDATTRLYQDEELSCFADIPNADILGSERLEADKPSSSMTLTRVWVNPDATIKYGRSDMSQFGAMLSGPLTAQLGGAAAAVQLRSLFIQCTWYVACHHTFQHNCFTQFYQGCGGGGSGHIFCGGGRGSAVDACPSAPGGCPFGTIDWQQTPVLQQTPQLQGFAGQPQMQAMGGQFGGVAQPLQAGSIQIQQCGPHSYFYYCPPRPTIFNNTCLLVACQGTQYFHCRTLNLVQCTVICTIGSPGCPIPTPHGGYDPGPYGQAGGFGG